MFKMSSKKVLLSLLISSFMVPTFAASPLESYIDQTINRQNSSNSESSSKSTTVTELLAMDHYDRHAALTNMLDKIQVGAEKGNAEDLFLLGYYYYSEGEDNEKAEDFHKAKENFLKAEKLGSKDAIYLLGELYFYGEGVPQDYQKAAQYYEKAAALKQKDALFSLGALYMNGFGFDEDIPKAMEYYRKAAELGDNTSINTLGYYYEMGSSPDIEINLNTATTWYQKSCDNGDSHGCDAVNRLKIHTLSFDTVFSEIVENYHGPIASSRSIPAVSTFLEQDDYDRDMMLVDYYPEIIKKAESKESDALYLLGLYYQVKGDDNYDSYAYGQAKILFEKAIELGSIDAIYSLAELYYYGNGVEQDYEKSFSLYADPKLESYPEAIFSLAVQYDSGEGVEQSYEKSFKLFEKAANLGHMPSTFNIGFMYEYGEYVDVDYEEAKKWYQKGCDVNYNEACRAVELVDNKINGNSHDSETNTELESLFNEIMGSEASEPLELTAQSVLNADNDVALEFLKSQTDVLLEKVKTDNDAESLFLTGYLFYLEGLDTDSDHTYSQSYALMEKAAAEGSLDAYFYLGVMSFHGDGTEKDYGKSREFMEKIENSGNTEALFYLATIYDEGLGVDIDQERSFNLYLKASNLGHSDSTYNVGFMYEYGEYVAEDLIEAQKWYQKACDLGDRDGCEKVANLNPAESLDDEAAFEVIDETPKKERNPIEGNLENFFNAILEIF
ncbi:sel1 repeat family protein [Ignatzschineria rhizosphaerae]|uniref:Sel1 repeat family protein n=1 Tax=Ignatzschineria rhizosphaerae TaxID=2923279 RepID=A0ABY3X4Y3_9GAMM|nr:tetratricopeptide repeat protein [Ignatzschineria rhizosphaerae]UNM95806.1 sel1 repeat family protein [Ignatzschineria rhizosphaerae]